MNQEKCSRCHTMIEEEDFDYDTDMCMYCLFPECNSCKAVSTDYDGTGLGTIISNEVNK